MALCLCELIDEVPLHEVAHRFQLDRGSLQNCMNTASTFCGMMKTFCNRMDWWELEMIMGGFMRRLEFGVKSEIIPLLEIPGVKKIRARSLYNAGYKTVVDIAKLTVDELLKNVKNLGQYRVKAAKSIIEGAQKLLKSQADELTKSAADLLVDAKGKRKRKKKET